MSPTTAAGGGAERVLLDHQRFLDRSRFEPVIAVLGQGTFAEEAKSLGIEVYVAGPHSDRQPLATARELYNFGRFVRDRRIDVLVGNKYRSIFYWGLSQARRRPFVWLLHDPLPQAGLHRKVLATVTDQLRPSHTVWVTPESSESYGQRFPHLLQSSSQIRPGTCPEDLIEGADAQRARRRWGIPVDAPIAAMFARMQESKGHLDLVHAAATVLKEYPETRFLLCGGTLPNMDPSHETNVKRAIAELGVSDRVLTLGIISEEEKKDILAASTLLVHPAVWEPFGIAVIEGMAVGKPVVVADARGPGLIVEHGQTGLVVPRSQPAALAEGISRLLRDPELAREMGERGAERVRERYHARVATKRLEDIFDGLPPLAASAGAG
ncbi:MAG TPA: glycosyltransferase family 4 protein [Polyangiaceae bacterium]|nr:glycosyltransferase family 4 protein [Polyangiaceae bacterium]